MKLAEFRWVRVIASKTTSGGVVLLIGTTDLDDRDYGIDDLLSRHLTELSIDQLERVETSISYMNSEGRTSFKTIYKDS
jgi:hypothetical protein